MIRRDDLVRAENEAGTARARRLISGWLKFMTTHCLCCLDRRDMTDPDWQDLQAIIGREAAQP